jgi:sugar/nucleoside kinase (ribokinase family)
MKHGLNIRQEGALDLVSLGALIHRLDPGIVPFRKANKCRIHVAPTCELDVLDRVGGGDGFASGFFYGLLTGESPDEALKLGWAHGALLTTFPGDTTMANVEQVKAFAKGGSARIQR